MRQRESLGPDRSHGIYLSRGEVVAVETEGRVPRLGEILSQRGFLDGSSQRFLTQRLAYDRRRRVGELLVDEGRLSPEVVGAALRKQLRLKLEVLFSLEDAVVSFHVACAPPVGPALPLAPREFLHGRPRARDRAARGGRRGAPSRPPPSRFMPEGKRSQALSLLGLDDQATLDEVTRAFRRLATQLHPDRHVHASDAERHALQQRFAALSAAYHLLLS